MTMTFDHPRLGVLLQDDVDWLAEDVHVPFCAGRVEVCLGAGTDDGPSQAALAGYDWIEAEWPSVLALIQEQAFEFYSPYSDAVDGLPVFAAPADLWGSEQPVSIRVFAKDEFDVTLRFVWQEAADPHVVTFYVENGRCRTHSVDG